MKSHRTKEKPMPLYNEMFEGPDSGWNPTCGMNRPACFVATSLLIYRPRPDTGSFDIVTGVRKSPTRWEAGMRMLTFGGFVDPNDQSVYKTALREATKEEIGNLDVSVDWDRPFIGGPRKNRWSWDKAKKKAFDSSGMLCQDVPVVGIYFLAQYVSGGLAESDEVTAPHWTPFDEIGGEYAFDEARVLEHFLPRIEASLGTPF